jgi:hypothetical protein
MIEEGYQPWSMLKDIAEFDWVIRPVYRYANVDSLLANLRVDIIDVANHKRAEIAERRRMLNEEWL